MGKISEIETPDYRHTIEFQAFMDALAKAIKRRRSVKIRELPKGLKSNRWLFDALDALEADKLIEKDESAVSITVYRWRGASLVSPGAGVKVGRWM